MDILLADGGITSSVFMRQNGLIPVFDVNAIKPLPHTPHVKNEDCKSCGANRYLKNKCSYCMRAA